MTKKLVVGISGNLTRPSKTKAFISHIAGEIGGRIGATSAVFDIEDLGSSFPMARRLGDLDPTARGIIEQLVNADVLVAGSPTFKGSYTGLFKHLFDLLDPSRRQRGDGADAATAARRPACARRRWAEGALPAARRLALPAPPAHRLGPRARA